MLNKIYTGPVIEFSEHRYARKLNSKKDIRKSSSVFENHAFSALLDQKSALGIDTIYQCRNVRADGYLLLTNGSWVMLEIKTKMSWQSMCAAFVQCVIAQKLCAVPTTHGLIVFGEFSADWERKNRKKKDGLSRWQIFDRHREELNHIFNLDALELTRTGNIAEFSRR